MSAETAASDPPDRLLPRLLGEICAAEGIDCIALARGWILRLSRGALRRDVYGYQFGLDAASACLIAHDKAATAELLAACGLPAVGHFLFRRAEAPGWIDPWPAISACFAPYALSGGLVCKPNTGSGGGRVERALTLDALRAQVDSLFVAERAIALSPWLAIEDEYRLILLDGELLLAYRKCRPALQGDGRSTLAGLAARQGLSLPPDLEPAAIPAAGEVILLSWKHNLVLGARAEVIDTGPMLVRLNALARRAVAAIGLRLAAVDLVTLKNQPAEAARVLEVNPGILLERFARQGEAEYALARQVYARIVKAMLAGASPSPG